jgi:hypothetical protein
LKIALFVVASLALLVGGGLWWLDSQKASEVYIDARSKFDALTTVIRDFDPDAIQCTPYGGGDRFQERFRTGIRAAKTDAAIAYEKANTLLSPSDPRWDELNKMNLSAIELEGSVSSRCYEVEMRYLNAR